MSGPDPQYDPRTYRPRTVSPQVRIEQPVSSAPTLAQYMLSGPGGRPSRWAGALAFWLGLTSVPLLWVLGTILELHVFGYVAAAISTVAAFFALVAFVAGMGRGLGFAGLILAGLGNIFFLSWLLTLFGN